MYQERSTGSGSGAGAVPRFGRPYRLTTSSMRRRRHKGCPRSRRSCGRRRCRAPTRARPCRSQRVETLTGALDRAGAYGAPVLAQLDGDLDAAMAQGDSRRCREVEARITRAYSAMLGGLRQLSASRAATTRTSTAINGGAGRRRARFTPRGAFALVMTTSPTTKSSCCAGP